MSGFTLIPDKSCTHCMYGSRNSSGRNICRREGTELPIYGKMTDCPYYVAWITGWVKGEVRNYIDRQSVFLPVEITADDVSDYLKEIGNTLIRESDYIAIASLRNLDRWGYIRALDPPGNEGIRYEKIEYDEDGSEIYEVGE